MKQLPDNVNNELYECLSNYLSRVSTLRGTLFHLKVSLKRESEDFSNRAQELLDTPALATSLVIGDMTGGNDKGWKINYHTGKNYVVGSNAYVVELNLLLDREASYTIVQAFEAFSTFLKDIVGTFLYLNPSRNDAYVKEVNIDSTLEYYKAGMRVFNAGRNNKEIFKLLRRISAAYVKGEEANNWGLNPYDWYQTYAIVRHSIVHSAGIIKNSNKDYIALSDLQRRIMAKLFLAENDPTEEVIYICVDVARAEKATEMLSEYAFHIFKSLSMEIGADWRVLKGQ